MTDTDVINLITKYQGSLKFVGYENEGREDLRNPKTGALNLGNSIWQLNLGRLYYRRGQDKLIEFTGSSIISIYISFYYPVCF